MVNKRSGFLGRHAILVLVLQTSGAGLAYGMHVVLARSMTAPEYGVFAYALGWAAVLGTAATLGLPGATLRFVAEYVAAAKGTALHGLWRWTVRLICTQALVVVGLGATATLIVGMAGDGSQWIFVALASALTMVLALTELSAATARSLERVGLAFAPQLVARPVGILLLVLAAVMSGAELTDVAALAVYTLVVVGVAVGQFLITHRSVRRVIRRIRTGSTLQGAHSEVTEWRAVARDLWVFTILGVLLRRLNLLILGAVAGPEEVALYNVSWKTSTLVGFILLSVNAVIAPRFASLYASNQRDQLQTLLRTAIHWILWPTLAGAAGLIILREPILSLFGSEYRNGAIVLVVLAMSQLVNVMAGSVGYLLNTTGHQRHSVRIYTGCLILNLLIAYPLISMAGALGAAIADGVILICWNVWMLLTVRRRLGVDPSIIQLFHRA